MENNTKKKLNTFDISGVYWVMLDLLKMYDTETLGLKLTDQQYLLYIEQLKLKYISELNTNVSSTQLDLEEEIRKIKAQIL